MGIQSLDHRSQNTQFLGKLFSRAIKNNGRYRILSALITIVVWSREDWVQSFSVQLYQPAPGGINWWYEKVGYGVPVSHHQQRMCSVIPPEDIMSVIVRLSKNLNPCHYLIHKLY